MRIPGVFLTILVLLFSTLEPSQSVPVAAVTAWEEAPELTIGKRKAEFQPEKVQSPNSRQWPMVKLEFTVHNHNQKPISLLTFDVILF